MAGRCADRHGRPDRVGRAGGDACPGDGLLGVGGRCGPGLVLSPLPAPVEPCKGWRQVLLWPTRCICALSDAKGAINLLAEVGKGSDLGRILGNGAAVTGKVFGIERVPVVKGQSMPAYDPRAIMGIGVTYATSTMGADHTAGYAVATNVLGVGDPVDPLKPEGQAGLSQAFQIATAAVDSTGMCLFVTFATATQPAFNHLDKYVRDNSRTSYRRHDGQARRMLSSTLIAAGLMRDGRYSPTAFYGEFMRGDFMSGQDRVEYDLDSGFALRRLVDAGHAVVVGLGEGVSQPLDVGKNFPERWERTLYRVCVDMRE